MKPIAALIAFSLTACATPTLAPPPAAIDFGRPPLNPEVAIREHMETVLRDPESARYRFDPPYKAYAHQAPRDGGNFLWSGYRIDFFVNAKNGYGGYVGYAPYVALFKNDQLVSAFESGTSRWTFTSVHDERN